MQRPRSRGPDGVVPGDDDDLHLTLRVSRWWVAFALTAASHAAVLVVLSLLPDPPKREERIEITVRPPPPPPASPPPVSRSPPAVPSPRSRPPPTTSPPSPPTPTPIPVRPELPPSEAPPEHRAVLPVAEVAPSPLTPAPPSPPSPPSTWRDRLLSSLAAPPPPAQATGALAPSTSLLQRVAGADARLHDDENEARLVVDYGPFFRRGLEALRGHWHPDEVLERGLADPAATGARDDVRRCAREARTTLAVAVIDREGEVVDVELKGASGCSSLDAEAVSAFRRVARFPHPPAGLFVDGEGAPSATARLPVRFTVTFDGGVRLDWR